MKGKSKKTNHKGIQKIVYENGKKSYRAQVRIKGHKPISRCFPREREAVDWKQQIETDIRRGKYFPEAEAGKRTVAELIERYIKETFPTRRSKHTPYQTLTWWNERVGHLPLNQLTTAVIKDHWDSLNDISERTGKPRAARTLNCYLETFAAALNKAWREYGWLQENPAARLKRKRLPQGRIRVLNDKERKDFLTEVEKSSNPFLRPAVLISICTGGRRTEVLSLKWEDVDLKEGSVTFRETKNGETRTVPLRGEALECVKIHAQKYRFTSEYLFPNRKPKWKHGLAKSDTPWEDPRAAFQKALKDAGIKNFTWHDMRHCTASYLVAAGATVPQTMQLLGHKTAQMTWRYSHLVPNHNGKVVENMSATFLTV